MRTLCGRLRVCWYVFSLYHFVQRGIHCTQAKNMFDTTNDTAEMSRDRHLFDVVVVDTKRMYYTLYSVHIY
jgi:hypothetical protein